MLEPENIMRYPKTLIALLLAVASAATLSPAAEKPNIILIISDDHAYSDYGFMGHEHIQTPNIDRIASQSQLYTRGYVTPVCSPSLASLLTGKLPHGHGITGNDLVPTGDGKRKRDTLLDRLLSNEVVLPQALGESGYLSFQSGKLWNASYREIGFTHGMTVKASRHGDLGLEIGRKGMKPIFDFIEQARAQAKPFFVWYAPFLPHTPHNPPDELLAKYLGKGPTPAAEKYYAMVEWFDQTCGELDRYLADNALSENTVVIYLADNGWHAALGTGSDRSKLSPYELGIRTPIFLRWPGKVPANRDGESLASIIDVVPTILKLAGAEVPPALPGLDLADPAAMAARKTIFMEAYTHDIADLDDPSKSLLAQVVIDGWSKLLIPGAAEPDKAHASKPREIELFDLRNDPLEKTNIASSQPQEVERLKKIKATSGWNP